MDPAAVPLLGGPDAEAARADRARAAHPALPRHADAARVRRGAQAHASPGAAGRRSASGSSASATWCPTSRSARRASSASRARPRTTSSSCSTSSRRRGSIAWARSRIRRRKARARGRLPDDVPEDVKRERLERLTELQRVITGERYEAHVGARVRVLVDAAADATGRAQARAPWQADDVDGVTWVATDAAPGDFVDVADRRGRGRLRFRGNRAPDRRIGTARPRRRSRRPRASGDYDGRKLRALTHAIGARASDVGLVRSRSCTRSRNPAGGSCAFGVACARPTPSTPVRPSRRHGPTVDSRGSRSALIARPRFRATSPRGSWSTPMGDLVARGDSSETVVASTPRTACSALTEARCVDARGGSPCSSRSRRAAPAVSSTDDATGASSRSCGADSAVQVINRVAVEAYLRGVVPLELGVRGPQRTRRRSRRRRSRRAATHVTRLGNAHRARSISCATTSDQVYGGIDAENALADAAIAATEGLVLHVRRPRRQRAVLLDVRWKLGRSRRRCGGRAKRAVSASR